MTTQLKSGEAYTLAEIRKLFHIKKNTLKSWARRGHLVPCNEGPVHKYCRADILALIANPPRAGRPRKFIR